MASLATIMCISFALLISSASATETVEDRHKQWMTQYGRTYKDATEREYRFNIFKDNLEYIESFNAEEKHRYKLGTNQFSDLTNEEFKAAHNGFKPSKANAAPKLKGTFKYVNFTDAPASVDWRTKGAVTPSNDEASLLKAAANQPISVAIDASGSDFQLYSSGVFTGECGTDLDHGVTVVGYGVTSDGMKYWLVKNSWGVSWGENGYIRMERDVDAEEGICGIAMQPSYPTA